MSEIRVKEGESLESALRRFKRSTARSGVLAEVRKREAYETPSVNAGLGMLQALGFRFFDKEVAFRAGLHFYFIGAVMQRGEGTPPCILRIVHRRAACPHAAATNRYLKKGHIYDFNPRIYL